MARKNKLGKDFAGYNLPPFPTQTLSSPDLLTWRGSKRWSKLSRPQRSLSSLPTFLAMSTEKTFLPFTLPL